MISPNKINRDGMINFAYITSCRETGIGEGIGRVVIDTLNGNNYGYREGNLENLARRLIDGNNKFAERFNLIAVVIDDNDEQYQRAWSQAELWPREISVPIKDGQRKIIANPTLDEMTIRIPSQPWKNLRRLEGENREVFLERKAQAKGIYETRILDNLALINVDLIVSDSYMTIFGSTLLNAYGRRILNIHPGITQTSHPAKLPGPTPTRDAYTRAVYGYIIVDDKKSVDVPEGPPIQVEYEEQIRKAVTVPRINVTGVTVHVVTKEVDKGPLVMHQEYTFDINGITPEAIRNMNYSIKREILPQAMLAYVEGPEVKRLITAGRWHNSMYPVYAVEESKRCLVVKR